MSAVKTQKKLLQERIPFLLQHKKVIPYAPTVANTKDKPKVEAKKEMLKPYLPL